MRAFLAVLFSGALLMLSGCTTGAMRDKDIENQSLKNNVALLEHQLSRKDAEINNLQQKLGDNKRPVQITGAAEVSPATVKTVPVEVKCRPGIKDIQIALLNAGFNPGVLDGKMGKKTRAAIKDFQKANNLPVDGKAGKATWNLLKEYLTKKAKDAS